MKNFYLFLVIISFLNFPNFLLAQNTCKPNKEFQRILKKSKVLENQYNTISNYVAPYDLKFVKNIEKSQNLNYKICDLEIISDSIFINGYIITPKNRFLNNVFFGVGNKIDTTYIFESKLDYIEEIIRIGPLDGFYLKDEIIEQIKSIDYYEIPENINFQYNFPISNTTLFIIGHDGDYVDIFDLNAIRKQLDIFNSH